MAACNKMVVFLAQKCPVKKDDLSHGVLASRYCYWTGALLCQAPMAYRRVCAMFARMHACKYMPASLLLRGKNVESA